MKEDELKIKQEIKTFLPFNQRNYGWVVQIRNWWTQNQSKIEVTVWLKIKIKSFFIWKISWTEQE
jgi:hypothetical protein